VLDSYGKFPNDGELRGNFYHIGGYYSCLDVNADSGYAKHNPFIGQYCNIHSALVADEAETTRNDVNNRGVIPPFLPPFDSILNSQGFVKVL
jgi:hypothetical protein